MGLAWGFGYFFTLDIFERYKIPKSGFTLLYLGIFLFSWIGAKVFFLAFSSGPKIYQYIYANYFWLGGGFVFYGGLIFGLLYYLIYTIVFKKFPVEYSKYLIPGIVFGHAIGRVGCFLAGCCYGSTTNSHFAFLIDGVSRYPVQIYEAIFLSFMGIVVLKMLSKQSSNDKIVATYLVSYSVFRFFNEFLRGDEIRGILWLDLSSSQWVSVIIIISTLLVKQIMKIKK
jgi:phosphatidylglycerol:prolipoprotein diacylglycerol transferase